MENHNKGLPEWVEKAADDYAVSAFGREFFKAGASAVLERCRVLEYALSRVLTRDWDWDMISSEAGQRRVQNFREDVEKLLALWRSPGGGEHGNP